MGESSRYRFVGQGVGVPGLPWEVTREEAKQLGALTILDAAIANGNYVEVKAEPPARSRKASGEDA